MAGTWHWASAAARVLRAALTNTQLLQQQGSPSGLLGLSHLLLLALQGPTMEAATVSPLRVQGDFPRPARLSKTFQDLPPRLGVRAPHLSLLHTCEAEHPPPTSHSSTSQGLTPPLPAPATEEVQVLWVNHPKSIFSTQQSP